MHLDVYHDDRVIMSIPEQQIIIALQFLILRFVAKYFKAWKM